jgi:mono/diheme cytochrome c family protein
MKRLRFFAIAAGAIGLIGFLLPGEQQVPASSPETTHLISSLDGANLYTAYCAVCHGADARGEGPLATSLKAAPSDLTRIAARNSGMFPRTRVERIISGEEQVPGGHGSRAMPVWGPIFSQVAWDQDLGRVRIRNLADYLDRLQKP